MSKTIIAEGRTTTEAIEKGLKELNTSKEMVDVEVLENQEKRSFFSILSPRVVKVKLTVKEVVEIKKEHSIKKATIKLSEEEKEKISERLDLFFRVFHKKNINVEYSVKYENDFIYVFIEGDDASKFIGYHGETLYSIQTILTCIINKTVNYKVHLIVDICGYREKRKKALQLLAIRTGNKVVKTRKQVILEPMQAYERKVIHDCLQNNMEITTYSVGEEPYRKVVITLK